MLKPQVTAEGPIGAFDIATALTQTLHQLGGQLYFQSNQIHSTQEKSEL